MAKLKDKSEISGMFGESLTVRKVNGQVIVKNRPKRKGKKGKLSEKLQAQRTRFQAAVAYAKTQSQDEEARALYAKAIKGKFESVYSVALADFINAPKVNTIDARRYDGKIGDRIGLHAKDDFMVTAMKVRITDADGVVIEEGDATECGPGIYNWIYTATAANPSLKGTKITAFAWDRPGNEASLEVVL
jgi:hypothetical protein